MSNRDPYRNSVAYELLGERFPSLWKHRDWNTPNVNYRKPDGEDCAQKTLATVGHGLKYGSMWAALEMVGRSQPNSLGSFAVRYIYWVAPAVAMTFTFASTTCLLGQIRGKDSVVNHMAGAALAASFIGLRYGTPWGLVYGGALSMWAGFSKHVHNKGFIIYDTSFNNVKDFGYFHQYDRTFGPRPDAPEPTNY